MTQYSGKIIRRTPVTATQQTASGVWTHSDVTAAVKQDLWPVAGVPCPINRSLRFRRSASAFLNRTAASPTDGRKATFSFWIKKADLSLDTNESYRSIFYCGAPNSDGLRIGWARYAGSQNHGFVITQDNGSSGAYFSLFSSDVFRDPSAWYHFLVRYDSTDTAANDRVKIFVNGREITSFTFKQNPVLNHIPTWQVSGTNLKIGKGRDDVNEHYDMYLAEVNFVDGQALTPTAFGTTDSQTGAWIPMFYTGTYGANGFRLNFRDNSSLSTIAADVSGNSNNWTTNNVSLTAGATYDSMLDVPTQWIGYNTGDAAAVTRGNYAVWSSINSQTSTVINEGNLKFLCSSGGSYSTCAGTVSVSSGKWYWELTYSGASGDGSQAGILASTRNLAGLSTSAATGTWSDGYAYSSNGNKVNNASGSAYGSAYTTGDIIGVALDLDSGTLAFYKNNVNQGTAYSSLSGSFAPSVGTFNSNFYQANFGQRPFAYTPPAGFRTLCSTNLPVPSIVKGNQHFDVLTYTGNAAQDRTITGLQFNPDLAWIKNRSAVGHHVLVNSVSGGTKQLFSNLTDAEQTNIDVTNGFTAGGIILGDNVTGTGSTNQSANNYVLWGWQGGGGAVSNTAGTIASQVSTNTAAGFSIVTYTGNGANATVGHGLGVAPKMVIVKKRSAAGDNWFCYVSALGNTGGVALNTTSAFGTDATIWNNTSPTSAVFSVGINTVCNGSAATYVAYCFAEVAGYSRFGSYTGNGSADGPFVYLGFRPRWIMVKRTDIAGNNWTILDSARDPDNAADSLLYPSLSNAENTGTGRADFLSNGFKSRDGTGNDNVSGGTYIFAAFAETPFKYSNAR